ncbi:MAG: hypothetical protein ABSG90_08260 [Dehalococcoidia bacterium]|jgi:hypothetical protein
MRRFWIFVVLTPLVAILPLAGCNAPPASAPVKGGVPLTNTTTLLVENSTSASLIAIPIPVKPDKVELVYFHTKAPCHCMALVGDSIQYVVDTYFKDEQADGTLKLTTIVSDDPANIDLVKKYDTLVFALWVTERRGSMEKTYTVDDIWLMTGDENKDKLVNFLRTKLTDILEGKST